jgi:hypothetical protein
MSATVELHVLEVVVAEITAWHQTYIVQDTERGLISLSRRPSLRLAPDPSDRELVTDAVVPLPLLAHRVYGDHRLWWVILDVNRVSRIFQAYFRGLPVGTVYRIPEISRVQAAVEQT